MRLLVALVVCVLVTACTQTSQTDLAAGHRGQQFTIHPVGHPLRIPEANHIEFANGRIVLSEKASQ